MTARLTLPLEISEMAKQKCLSAQIVIYEASTEGGEVCLCVCVCDISNTYTLDFLTL